MSSRSPLLQMVTWLYRFSFIVFWITSFVSTLYGAWAIIKFISENAFIFIEMFHDQVLNNDGLLINLLITIVIGMVSYWVLRPLQLFIFRQFTLETTSKFDPATSIELTREPDAESYISLASQSLFQLPLVLASSYTMVYAPGYFSLSLFGTGLILLLSTWVRMARALRSEKPRRTYYPRSKEFYKLRIKRVLEDIDKDEYAKSLEALIDGPDGEAARAEILKLQDPEYKLPWDNVSVSDPETHYGPTSRDEMQAWYDAIDLMEESDERLG